LVYKNINAYALIEFRAYAKMYNYDTHPAPCLKRREKQRTLNFGSYNSLAKYMVHRIKIIFKSDLL